MRKLVATVVLGAVAVVGLGSCEAPRREPDPALGPRATLDPAATDLDGRAAAYGSGQSQPSGSPPSGSLPSGSLPSENRPNEGKPSENRPNEGKPSEGKPNEGKPSEGKPSEAGPAPGGAKVDWGEVYWTDSGGPKLVRIDITDAQSPEGANGSLDDIVERCHGNCDGIEEKFDPKDPLFPAGFAVGDRWVVVQPTGPHVGTTVAFGIEGGASETHFVVLLSGVPPHDVGGLSYRGRAPVYARATLAAAVPLGGVPRNVMRALKAEISRASFEPKMAPFARKYPLRTQHVKVFAPRMPGKAKYLAQMVIEFPEPGTSAGEDGLPYYIAGIFIVDEGGKALALAPLRIGIEAVEVTFLVDLDGDGYDEIVWDDFYYEGTYTNLTRWDAGTPRTRSIGGDGA